jgi:nucleoside-diphosphate-sugar epimerase
MRSQKILITGCYGLIGSVLWNHLGGSFELYGLDISSSETKANIFKTDITKSDEVNKTFDRIPSLTYIIHLAGDPRVDADWE